jgi:hypothetical protein
MRAIDAENIRIKPEFMHNVCGMAMIRVEDVVRILNEQSTIQPKRGRWHYSDGKPARIGMSFGVICDQCGTESEYCTNFCGECGADMREVTT